MYVKDNQIKANNKWRQLNPDKWAEINREQAKKNYELNKDQKKRQVNNRYHYKKEVKEFLNILL